MSVTETIQIQFNIGTMPEGKPCCCGDDDPPGECTESRQGNWQITVSGITDDPSTCDCENNFDLNCTDMNGTFTFTGPPIVGFYTNNDQDYTVCGLYKWELQVTECDYSLNVGGLDYVVYTGTGEADETITLTLTTPEDPNGCCNTWPSAIDIVPV